MLSSLLKHTLCLATGALALSAALPAAAQFSLGAEYEALGYSKEATHNPVARLQQQLDSGEITLEYRQDHGYFAALIAALGIDLSSQVLVFSPTSLQYRLIGNKTPRALYFSDDTYIGLVQNSTIIEVTTHDEILGTVFYIFNNVKDQPHHLVRENERCLVCHDSGGLGVGGVPQLMVRSGLFDQRGFLLQDFSGVDNTSDTTPIAERWGGWYVTGQHGAQPHLGNIILNDATQLTQVAALRQGNLDTLENAGFFTTSHYPRATSDIVALLVLEHQVTVENQITYVKFKAPRVLERTGHGDAVNASSWAELPVSAQKVLTRMLDKLADALLFVAAAPFEDRISGAADYAAWFQQQGPRDAQGRGLRDFALDTRLFRYPLSYLVLSRDFDSLPPYAKDYVYQQIAARLAHDTTLSATAEERQAALEILSVLKEDFAPYAALASARAQ
ncbi:MAG: hypothetical protein LBF16_15325 [Pseudomonadales bacterium]|jgi:hypothetical protein|nr:hypothetical protein [Pseudomonadales bacterium]